MQFDSSYFIGSDCTPKTNLQKKSLDKGLEDSHKYHLNTSRLTQMGRSGIYQTWRSGVAFDMQELAVINDCVSQINYAMGALIDQKNFWKIRNLLIV